MTDDLTPLRVRHGNRNVQNIYQLHPDGSETFCAVAMSPELAGWFVNAINAAADTRPGPTQWAYDQACAALEKHRVRADEAEAEIGRLHAEIHRAVHNEGEGECEHYGR